MEEAYHAPAPVSMYCILFSLNRDIQSLLRHEETYILPPCNLGQCSTYIMTYSYYILLFLPFYL